MMGMKHWRAALIIAGLALGLVAPGAGQAQDRVSLGWGRISTNDGTGDGRDRWRSGSYTISHLRGPEWTGRLPTQPGALLEYRLEGFAITPADLVTPDPKDRRYVGALVLGLHSHFDLSGLETSVGMDVVVTGPQSGIGRLQTRLHKALDLPEPQVLDDQIPNDSHIVLSGEIGRSLTLGSGVTLRPFAAAQLGEETMLRAGADLMVGRFADNALMLRDRVSGQRYRGIAGERVPGLTWIAGADAAHVFDSAYLPGSGAVTLEPVRLRARTGVYWQGKSSDVFFGLSWLGPEFVEQPTGQTVGSLAVRIVF